MLIKSVLPFIAAPTGGKPGRRVSTDEGFAPGSDLARRALDLGCLRDADARAVAQAQGVDWPTPTRPAAPAAAAPVVAQDVDDVAPLGNTSGGRK